MNLRWERATRDIGAHENFRGGLKWDWELIVRWMRFNYIVKQPTKQVRSKERVIFKAEACSVSFASFKMKFGPD